MREKRCAASKAACRVYSGRLYSSVPENAQQGHLVPKLVTGLVADRDICFGAAFRTGGFTILRYLVTGGAGFIGSNVVDELVAARPFRRRARRSFERQRRESRRSSARKIDLRVGSITDLATVQSACVGADYVIHLAARTSVPKSVKDPLETNHVNIDGTLHVLVAARDAKVRRFVYAASSSAYGETPTLPKTETMQPQPISPYGVTKFVGELYAQVFGRVYGLENASVRYFNVFGPRQDPTSQYSGVLSRFMLAILRGEPLVIYGDGEQSRDFTYIDNVVDETLRACEAAGASGKVFNGGTGARITLNRSRKAARKSRRQKAPGEIRPASRRRHPRFASGRFARAKNPRLRAARPLRRRPAAHLGVVQIRLRPEVTLAERIQRTRSRLSGTLCTLCLSVYSVFRGVFESTPRVK